MAREPVSRIITKVNHWPIAEQREYLIKALAVEKVRYRRKKVSDALRGITTRVLKQELREPKAPVTCSPQGCGDK